MNARRWIYLLLVATVSITAERESSALAATQNTPISLGPWHTTGPLKAKAFSDALFPERAVDLGAKNDKGQPLWRPQPDWMDGVVNGLSTPDSSSTYLFRLIKANAATNITAGFGSDDGIEVWLNGKKIHSNNVPRGVEPDQDKVKLELAAGENRLLVKIFNITGGCGFYFAAGGIRSAPMEGNPKALRLAIEDLGRTFPGQYTHGPEFLKRLEQLEAQPDAEALRELQREALLANPLMNFDRLMLIKRGASQLGLPQNWQGNCALPGSGYDNEIALLSPVRPDGKLTTFHKPAGRKFVGDVDLNFEADKLLFSSIGSHNRWQIFELNADGTGLRQLTATNQPDFDNYDACYLPSGKIIFGSTACFHGVPCVGGGNTVANLYLMDSDGQNMRRLTFDQDHDWCPVVMNNGRVLYTRWEYSDTPHYFTRILFEMNPDGTDQREYVFSNSYWPNSTFYARPIPGHPTKVVAVISGHHGVPRMGELLVFDPAAGRRESEAVVQRIPGYGKKVPPTITDGLVEGSWPKFLHPYPLSEKYFLVSCKPNPQANWGIYLVDIFDNLLLLAEEPGYALLEPVPMRATPRPPVIPDKVNLAAREATMFIADVYAGPGLAGVPRGTVKSLRLYSFHYAYPGMGGHINIGIDGPWDARRILGTVPVEADGSAMFRVPANTPIAMQPLDAQGRAVQVMRSWCTAMPGEKLSCIGCHEQENATTPSKTVLASLKPATEITPWYGPERPFGFMREVQPVLDRYCVGCHDGATNRPDLRAKKQKGWGGFDPSYIALHPYVRRPGPESDYHLQAPLEWHASTSELVQMLESGHHNVKLDREAWDRLTTWIDLNVPDHSTWAEHRGKVGKPADRRLAMNRLTANVEVDPEAVDAAPLAPVAFVQPAERQAAKPEIQNPPGWPFDTAEAKRRQAAAGAPPELKINFSNGLALELVLIPAGEFVMGDEGEPPVRRARIDKPFYMAKHEVLNGQYRIFDSGHHSGYVSGFKKDQGDRGMSLNQDRQPAVRLSWQQAKRFCDWLSLKSDRKFSLPSEEEWEYACRAGTATVMNFGALEADFGKFANLADRSVLHICRGDPQWIPCVSAVQDGAAVTSGAGRYAPNAWGLYDMHGNAAEWTLSDYSDGKKVVRGGSFYDRPKRARSAFRLAYQPWQRVFDVGFRVVCEVGDGKASTIMIVGQ
jgi:formylglycine-generating enzyme required for sulfatase activity